MVAGVSIGRQWGAVRRTRQFLLTCFETRSAWKNDGSESFYVAEGRGLEMVGAPAEFFVSCSTFFSFAVV